MKKSVFFLTLLLCLSLIFPGAHAEDTYVPGERMRSLVSSALEAGQLVGGEAHFSLTLPDSMLPDDEEGRAQFDALAEVIQGVSLAGGMGRLDDGYRVELGGAYTAPSGDNVYVTGAANLTADGLSLESNLIEGERLSIRWETLLEMLGLSENEIDALLSLPTTDWDSALNELNDELAHSSIRFSLGRFTTEEEIDYTIELVRKSIGRLRDLSPLWEMYKQGVDLNSIEWAHH